VTATLVRAREQALSGFLDAVVSDRLPAWLDTDAGSGDADWDGGLRVLALVLSHRWADAMVTAAGLPGVPPADEDGWCLRYAAALWAASGDPGPGSGDLLSGLQDAQLPDTETALGRFTGYLVVEAVLAHGRLDLATTTVDRLGDRLWEPTVVAGRLHPFTVVPEICRARVMAFRGDIREAAEVLAAISPPAEPLLRALLAGTSALVRGNDADAADVRRFVADVDTLKNPEGHLAVGSQMLAAFGEIALFDMTAAARRVLVAGGDEDLSRLNVIDRALALEMLIAFAVAETDLDAAEAWADRITPLVASPIADSTAARALSRVALLAGRAEEAVVWAERAVARAREVDRVIEYVEGEIVLNRARLEHPGSSGGAAARALSEMVAEAEQRGHGMARRAAARELRVAGLRLPPLAGSGWAGLSEREAAVARMVATGAGNREVAAALHVSDHTVRAHVSRILAAFGVATRSGLPAAMQQASAAPATTRPALTPRQREVVALIASGLPNDEIATRLGLSPRTVERHVSDVLVRWSLPNRTALAQSWHGQSG
jgi:DNA-binding NarL/FixJ family response regulator